MFCFLISEEYSINVEAYCEEYLCEWVSGVNPKVVLITINSMESDALIGPMKKTNEICICIVCSGPMRASDSY